MSAYQNDPVTHDSDKQRGANLVEYMLLCALIAVIAVVALRVVGLKVSQRYSFVTSAVW